MSPTAYGEQRTEITSPLDALFLLIQQAYFLLLSTHHDVANNIILLVKMEDEKTALVKNESDVRGKL